MNYEIIYKNLIEGLYFLIIVLLIFDISTSITYKLSLTNEILRQNETFFYGLLSVNLALLNIITKSFFGFELFK